MHLRTLFVLLVSFTLFSYQCKKSQTQAIQRSKLQKLQSGLEKKVKKNLKKGQQGAIENSINLGIKRGLSFKTYRNFKNLNLLHLFTPSGLHYFPIFWVLRFIFSFRVLRYYSILFWIASLFLDGFYSLKRIAALKMLWLWRKLFPWKIELFHFLLMVFCFDLIFGSFSKSPLSWGYSFLFLGLITNGSDKPFIQKIAIGQVFISLFEANGFNLLSFLFGYFISLGVSFLFPYLFVSYWSPWGDLPLISSLIYLISKSVLISNDIASYFPRLNVFGFLVLIWSLKRGSRITLSFILFLL